MLRDLEDRRLERLAVEDAGRTVELMSTETRKRAESAEQGDAADGLKLARTKAPPRIQGTFDSLDFIGPDDDSPPREAAQFPHGSRDPPDPRPPNSAQGPGRSVSIQASDDAGSKGESTADDERGEDDQSRHEAEARKLLFEMFLVGS